VIFFALAHRLLHVGLEIAPRLYVNVNVGNATQSLQV
jgi:hypothetical protein